MQQPTTTAGDTTWALVSSSQPIQLQQQQHQPMMLQQGQTLHQPMSTTGMQQPQHAVVTTTGGAMYSVQPHQQVQPQQQHRQQQHHQQQQQQQQQHVIQARVMMDPVGPPSQQQQQQQLHVISQTPSAAIGGQSQLSQEPKSSAWSEHIAPSGVKYYYNSIAKESTYERPAELDGVVEPSHKNVAIPATPSSTASVQRSWKEYKDPTTGKTYYSDGVTSTWVKPLELGGGSGTVDSQVLEEGAKRQQRQQNEHFCSYATQEEAHEAFRSLLIDKQVGPTAKWAVVVKACSSDARWNACTTLGQRKQLLAEYQTKRAKEEKEEKRLAVLQARRDFREMLLQKLPPQLATGKGGAGSGGGSAALGTQYSDQRERLMADERFFGVEEESTRQELFYDYIEEMKKREERIKAAKKKAVKDNFLAFLQEKEEAGSLTYSATW